MNRVNLIRAVILMVLAPLTGLGTLVYLLATAGLEAWHLPLVIGLVFGPVVAWDRVTGLGQSLERVGRALQGDES